MQIYEANIPIEAKARDVRSHARKVLSVCSDSNFYQLTNSRRVLYTLPNAKWSRATLPLFSSSIAPNLPRTVGVFTFDPLVWLLLSGAAAGVCASWFSPEASGAAAGDGKGSSWLLFPGR